MKRIICLLLVAALVLGLAGCGMVSDRVLAVEKAIDEIGEVTLESADRIAEARKAFDRLPEKEKKNVSNARKLVAAEEELQDLKNNGTVTELIDAIWALRDIIPASAEEIESLQEQIEALPQKLRDRVNNSGRLQEAREVLAVSETIEGLGEILPALKEVPARLKEAGEESLADVQELLDSAKESIDEALAEFDSLEPELQRMLGNSSLLEDAADWYQAAQYAVAEKYFGEWEMESALELYRQFPEDYKETASRIVSAENFLNWQAAQADLPGKWAWDGELAAGADGKTYRADFPELTIRELEPDEAFAGIRFREKRLLYVEIKASTVKKAELSKTVLNKLHELRPNSFTAANIES